MAGNLYEAVMTRNASLARFFDENHNVAAMVKKFVGHVANISHEWHCDASKIKYDMHASPDGRMVVIKLDRP
jgi:hypothetical protein